MFVVNFLTCFPRFSNWEFLVSNWEKKIRFGFEKGAEAQIKQKMNTGISDIACGWLTS